MKLDKHARRILASAVKRAKENPGAFTNPDQTNLSFENPAPKITVATFVQAEAGEPQNNLLERRDTRLALKMTMHEVNWLLSDYRTLDGLAAVAVTGMIYDWCGYDSDGYGRDGFTRPDSVRNTSGVDRWGYGRDGFNARGYDKEQYDRTGRDQR